jgi:hypothetical protein
VKVPFAVLSFAMLAVAAASAASAPAPVPSAAPAASARPLSQWQRRQLEMFRDSAPADEYFGKMKMSYLGMNNTFRDAAISSGDHTTNPGIVNRVALAEDALEAWARKYPRDPQLARTYYLATVVERKIWLQPNQQRAWIYLNRLVQLFPTSYFGKLLATDLKIGFTEHYYAMAQPCPAAPPTPPPVDEGVDTFFVPPPLVGMPAAPTPSPSPLPSVTPVALGPGLRVLVLPQSCVPPSPSPSPSASASASPAAPSPSVAPAATATPSP